MLSRNLGVAQLDGSGTGSLMGAASQGVGWSYNPSNLTRGGFAPKLIHVGVDRRFISMLPEIAICRPQNTCFQVHSPRPPQVCFTTEQWAAP